MNRITKTINIDGKNIQYYEDVFGALSSDDFFHAELDDVNHCLDIPDGGIFLDIGAAYGSWTLPALVKGARVLAFEPNPYFSQCLLNNVSINNASDRFRLIKRAVWDEVDKIIPFHMFSAIGLEGHYYDNDPFFVKTITLDSLILPRLDLIKIDVEGAETYVIRGARETLSRYKPVIILEHHPSLSGDISEVIQPLQGYSSEQYKKDRWILRPRIIP